MGGKNNGASLVYYLHDSSATFRLALSGDLIREAVPGVEQAWLTAMSVMGRKSFLIDVSRITRVDYAFRPERELAGSWLRWCYYFKAAFEARTAVS